MMFKKQLVTVVFILCAFQAFAQVKISGVVYNEYLEPFYNAKITSSSEITASNTDGEFTITVSKDLPQTITVSAFGHQTEYVEITEEGQSLNVILKENFLLDQVVISASRVPERIIESPVTIERFGLTDIKRTSSNSFYDGLVNIKGIQSREGSYGFKSINTRGFADYSNSRFVQLVDGMDTAAPALNFSAGNLSGVSELDINNVEVLPGASSALYGANAYNGIMLMRTKNPFDYTGASILLKSGHMYQRAAGANPIYDVSVRLAHRFSDAFAAKVNFSYFEAEEWHANDNRNRQIDTNEIIPVQTSERIFDYDGINTYGDETFTNITSQTSGFYAYPDGRNILVNRTGYAERDLLRDYESKNLKFSTSLHYRPFEDESLELILATRLARGNNILQGNSSRFAQRDYYIGQSKFEVKGDNFYVRTYYTRNDAGNTYDLTRTGLGLVNASNAQSFSGSWGFDFAQGLFDNGADRNDLLGNPDILDRARAYADSFRLNPGTPAFRNAFNQVTSTLITEGGSKIYDRSSYTHVDGNYNFTSLLNDWADVQIGGSFRQYNPDSRGTIFNDGTEAIRVSEYGIYSQIQKKFLDERLKLTGSIRYDKSQNFDANYSPRFAVNYALGEDKNHIIRASYQTGFRNPTIQEQYLFNQPGRKINIGTSRDNLDRIAIGQDIEFVGFGFVDGVISGDDIINNSLLTRSVFREPGYTGANDIKSEYTEIKPEEVQTIELGYRSMVGITDTNNINIDINGFYSFHNDFVFFQDIVTPKLGKVYPFGTRKLTATELADPLIQAGRIVDDVLVWDAFAEYSFNNAGPSGELLVQEFNIITNSKSKVNSYGAGIALTTKLMGSYDLGLSYNYIDFSFEDKDLGLFEPNFNTPKHTAKVQFGNNNLFKNFGFNVNGRWLDSYRWVSPFVKGYVKSRTVIDAQLNYRIPSIKSKFKIGGTNLFGKEYQVAPGTGNIGKLYYISWIFNN